MVRHAARARDRPGRNVTYVPGDALRLPIPDRSFDRVVSVTALCFVDDWRRALAEIARVARRRFAVGLLNRRSLLWRDKGRDGGQGAYQGARWHDAGEMREALASLPAGETAIRSAVFFPSGTGFARVAEHVLPGRLARGGFIAVAGMPRR